MLKKEYGTNLSLSLETKRDVTKVRDVPKEKKTLKFSSKADAVRGDIGGMKGALVGLGNGPGGGKAYAVPAAFLGTGRVCPVEAVKKLFRRHRGKGFTGVLDFQHHMLFCFCKRNLNGSPLHWRI